MQLEYFIIRKVYDREANLNINIFELKKGNNMDTNVHLDLYIFTEYQSLWGFRRPFVWF